MERIIVRVGFPRDGAVVGGEEQKEWMRPIREFLERKYPRAINELLWITDIEPVPVEEQWGYGISYPGEVMRVFSPRSIKILEREGYKILTREDVCFEENLKRILK